MAHFFTRSTVLTLAVGFLLAPWTQWAQSSWIPEAKAAETPSVVESLKAFPGDQQVTLTWDAATDDVGVDGYTVYTGLSSYEDKGSYNLGDTDAGNTTTYVMDNLTNGLTYYFAVVAYDEDGNESSYSKEVEATPEASDAGDFTAPTVTHAEAVSSTLVEVSFSEEVALPDDASTAFSLESTDGTAIEVLDAYKSTEDASTVFLVTDTQDSSADYILTAGIEVADAAGNPVESGTSDTAIFAGSSLEKTDSDPVEDTEDPTVTPVSVDGDFAVEEVEATTTNELIVHFSQKVGDLSASGFTIEMTDDASTTLEVLAVTVDEDDATQVTLVTEDMEAGFDYVLTMDETVVNEADDALLDVNRSVDFTAPTLDLEDLIPPEDVLDLLAEAVDETTVTLSWTASVDSAGDLAKYLLYQSMDGGSTFDSNTVKLDKDSTETDVEELTAGETYTFKVTAVDENGNESEGEMTTVTLPEAGPELFVLAGLAMAGAGVLQKRRRTDEA